ncbi:UbiA family prenyltransferase [Streptomyces uncialis]|uniref:UbiA family prenyltransferase n=1 Tax=Streptomyces uncialis TaxID=1048205 RepID=UPI0009A1286B|nr:UbiA family prenyltransferase [Streptomyces uncialis]
MPRAKHDKYINPATFTAGTEPGEPSAPPKGLRFVALCLRESRGAVLAIFLLRFLLAGTADGTSRSPAEPALFLGAAVWISAVTAVYLYNGVTDVEEDRSNGSTRPVSSGLLPLDTALRTARGLAAAAVVGAVLVGPLMCAVTVGFLLLGYAYSAPRIALKRHTPGTIAAVIGGGALTYVAGLLCGATPLTPASLAFCGAMCLWMGLVGAIAKDFSDAEGDARHGRRNWTVLWGPAVTACLVCVSALTIGTGLLLCALSLSAPGLLLPSAVLLGSALVLAAVALTARPDETRAQRRVPYRIFMVTQYATHLVAFALPIT